MNRVLVLNVAADFGGSETVLNNFFLEIENSNLEFDFVLSRNFGHSTENLKIYPWIKKSWLHRLYFDYMYLPKIMKKTKYDAVYSMQNTFPLWLKSSNVKKFLLVHQSIQYYKGAITLFSLEGIKLNIRKWIIGFLINRSLKFTDYVFVQSQWMKRTIVEELKHKAPQIDIVATFNDSSEENSLNKTYKSNYFYPAGSSLLKNHLFLISAWINLRIEYGMNPRLYLTINENDNNTTRRIARLIKKYELNIKLTGYLNHDEMDEIYKKSILVYPSLIETYSIPLYEGKNYNSMILALDRDYSREALLDYPNGYLYSSEKEFIDLIYQLENKQLLYSNEPFKKDKKYPKVSDEISTLIKRGAV